MTVGFYQRIYNGKTEVLVRRKKIIRDDPVTNGELKSRYIQLNNYYVKKKGVYSEVNGKKSLFRLFGDKDKEIRKYFKANKIKYNKFPELAIAKAAEYYDLLTN